MGSNCSCLHGENDDDKQIVSEQCGIQFDKQKVMPLGSSLKDNNLESTNFSRMASDIISLQSVLRGYLERNRSKYVQFISLKDEKSDESSKDRILSSAADENASNPKEFSRPDIQEMSLADVPEYPNQTIKAALTKLGQFIYSDNLSQSFITKGPVLMENRAIFIGEWNHNNLRHGKGKQIWPDGSMYEGYWDNDRANGKGRLIHANGDAYEGDWKNDKAHGYGFYIHSDGAKYEGQWINDKQHGNGIEIWPDGAKYQGKYENGLKHGSGKFEWADNSSYEGEFSQNNIYGKGVYMWSDGRKYIGDWENNKMHGKGIFTWKDGRSYNGEYIDDKKHGYGVFIWANGRKYEGDWRNGKQDGRGIFTSQTGEVKEGEWRNGKRLRSFLSTQDT